MKIKRMQPPLERNSEMSFKRAINLHSIVIIVSFLTIVLQVFYTYYSDHYIDVLLHRALLIGIALVSSIAMEIVFVIIKKDHKALLEYSTYITAINTGLIMVLLLADHTPLFIAAISVIVVIIVQKWFLNRFERYLLQPTVAVFFVLTLVFPMYVNIESIPLVNLYHVVKGIEVSMVNPLQLVLGNYEMISIGAANTIILGFAFIYLTVTNVIDMRISLTYIITVAFMALGVGLFHRMPITFGLIHLCSGLTLFAAVFLISDSYSSPTSRETKIAYAVAIAIVTITLRTLTNGVDGVIFAILIGNIITFVFSRIIHRSNQAILTRTILYSCVTVTLFTVGLGIYSIA